MVGVTTGLINTLSNKLNNNLVGKYTYDYNYANNISSISVLEGGVTKTITYYYNELSFLTREDNEVLEKTITYDYDDGGNIISMEEYAYTTDDILGGVNTTYTYSYPTDGWNDQLEGFIINNDPEQTIEYDAIGNPTSYLGNTFTWQYGRKLTGVNSNISYAYSTSGGRLSKTVDGLKTTYITIGGALVQEKNSQYELNYYYDSSGVLIYFGYTNLAEIKPVEKYYYYMRNAQGDITALYTSDNNPELVGKYIYDSWGKIVSVKNSNGTDVSGDPGHIMNINPFRYRGYYYDRETGFYYLQSRYYDPGVKRFINADGLVSTGTGVMGYNMFAYCLNNPVNLSDPSGACPTCASVWAKNNPKPVLLPGYTPGYNPATAPKHYYKNTEAYNQALAAWNAVYYPLYHKVHTSAPLDSGSYTISSGYGPRTPTISGASTFHCGIDLVANRGAPIYAVMGGEASICWDETGFGNYIIITSGNRTDYYGHMSGFAVSSGPVNKGQLIGFVGSTGVSSTYHLHFEVRINGIAISNPQDYLITG